MLKAQPVRSAQVQFQLELVRDSSFWLGYSPTYVRNRLQCNQLCVEWLHHSTVTLCTEGICLIWKTQAFWLEKLKCSAWLSERGWSQNKSYNSEHILRRKLLGHLNLAINSSCQPALITCHGICPARIASPVNQSPNSAGWCCFRQIVWVPQVFFAIIHWLLTYKHIISFNQCLKQVKHFIRACL